MINVKELVKWYGPKLAVDHVSFEVNRGEVLGFLGPNGAGKSTTMRMITGYLPMSEGSVEIGGNDITEKPLAAKALFGYLPENAPSYADMTVEAFLNFTAAMRDLGGQAKKDAVEKAIETCHLGAVRHQSIDTLSKGFFHRTCFAQAILHDPPVLILDEPTDGLDPNQKHEMRELIKRMGQDKAIIVSTHILEEVEAICSRVIIIDQGKLVFNGTPAEMCAKSADAGNVTVRVKGVQQEDLRKAIAALPEAGQPILIKENDGVLTATVPAKQQKNGLAAAIKHDFDKRLISKENDDVPTATVPAKQQKNGLAAAIKHDFDKRQWDFDELHTNPGRLDDVFRTITSSDNPKD